jgi:hypothetical protein
MGEGSLSSLQKAQVIWMQIVQAVVRHCCQSWLPFGPGGIAIEVFDRGWDT